MKLQEKWFTLVELMVVVVILGVLGAVGMVSYSSYLWGSRDSNRLTQLSDIKSWLSIYTAKGRALPLPENSIDILAWANIVAYQGYAWEKTLGLIGYQDGGTDPLDDTYFTYYIDKTKKSFQLMGFLEEDTNLAYSPIPQSYAEDIDYSERIPTVTGSKLGALVEQGTNTPVQGIGTLSSGIDITGTSQTYHAYYSDSEVISGSGAVLGQTIANQSCKRLLDLGRHNGSGIYRVSPTGVTDIQVYCDMETDGGGWTSIVRFNPSKNNSSYWQDPKHEGEYYNLLDLKDNFDVHEIYVNKQVWYDGGEYVFEKIGDDLYARRGWLKDTVIRTNWSGLSATLLNWLWFYATVWGYTLIGHTYTTSTYYDFPFYPSWLPGVSDNPWWGRQYDDNVIVNIFIR